MANEQQPNGRRGVDYANFPPDVAYIALSDVRAAYAQGRADAAAEYAEAMSKLTERSERQSEDLQADALERTHGIPRNLY